MAYTPATKLPSLHHTQWSLPAATNPKLSAPLAIGATTAYFTTALYDYAGVKVTGDVLIGVKNSDSYVETMYIPTGGIAGDGLSATVVRGIRLEGLDYTTGDASLQVNFSAGDAVFCNISGVIQDLAEAAIKGTIATGGTGITMGTEPGAGGETITLYRSTTAGAKKGFFRWYVTNGKCQYSNDGTTWVNSDDVTASDLVKVSAADTTAGYLQDKVNAGDGLTEAIGTPGGDETLDLSVDATDLVSGDYGLEVNSNDFRVKLATDPGLEFSTGLRVKVKAAGGITRDSNGLSVDTTAGQMADVVAGETLVAGETVYIKGATITTLTPDNDGEIRENQPNTVFNSTTFTVGVAVAAGDTARACLHFDISSSPASVEKAYLRIIQTQAAGAVPGNRKINADYLTGAFDETTLTWNNAPGIGGATVASIYNVRHNYADGAGLIFDFTTIYNTIWNTNNYGAGLRWSNETAGTAFSITCGSNSNANAADRPQLVLISKDANFGRAYKCSANENVPGFKGVVITGGSAGATCKILVIGTYSGFTGLTAWRGYKASTAGALTAASNALDAQLLAYSTTQAQILDKRKEYASDVLATQNTIGDLDASISTIPAGMLIDNVTGTARTSSTTTSMDGYNISFPTDTATTTSAIGMATVDVVA